MIERITSFFLDPQYRGRRLLTAFIIYFLILALGSIPHAREALGQVATGLVLHSLAYATITLFLFAGDDGNRLKKSLRAFLIVATMGAIDEYVQSFLSYRHAAISDWAVDCVASLITILALLMIRRYDVTPS